MLYCCLSMFKLFVHSSMHIYLSIDFQHRNAADYWPSENPGICPEHVSITLATSEVMFLFFVNIQYRAACLFTFNLKGFLPKVPMILFKNISTLH